MTSPISRRRTACRSSPRAVRDNIAALDNVESASFYRTRSYCNNVYYQNTQFSGAMFGIDARYFDTAGYEVQQGRGFLSREYTDNAKAVILDSTAVKSLYSSEDPVGTVIDINGRAVYGGGGCH